MCTVAQQAARSDCSMLAAAVCLEVNTAFANFVVVRFVVLQVLARRWAVAMQVARWAVPLEVNSLEVDSLDKSLSAQCQCPRIPRGQNFL